MSLAPDNDQPLLARLEAKLLAIAKTEGDFTTAIPALTVHRRNSVTEPMPCIYSLGLAITVRGGKQVTFGNEVFNYEPGEALLASVDMPAVSRVTSGSLAEPYIGIMLCLDTRMVQEMAAQLPLRRNRKGASQIGIRTHKLDPAILDAITRLVDVNAQPALCQAVAPLIQREIICRILVSDCGPAFLSLNEGANPGRQIASCMAWMKQHYMESVSIDSLAEQAFMSPTSFRQHFKAVAGMSPLQYLKNVRLQEARVLMLNEGAEAGAAGLKVGYESVSQFNREYSRLFGAPPLRDIKRVREQQTRQKQTTENPADD